MLSSLNNQVKAQITFHQKFLFVKFDKRMWQKKGYGDKQMAKDIMHIFTIEWAWEMRTCMVQEIYDTLKQLKK